MVATLREGTGSVAVLSARARAGDKPNCKSTTHRKSAAKRGRRKRSYNIIKSFSTVGARKLLASVSVEYSRAIISCCGSHKKREPKLPFLQWPVQVLIARSGFNRKPEYRSVPCPGSARERRGCLHRY